VRKLLVACLSCLMPFLGVLVSGTSVAREVNESHIAVQGLNGRTEILVDQWGVPHIYASTPHDAFFTQGWNAARDRLWQMDLWRRSGLGELAAVLGPAYVAQDRAIRLFVYRGNMDAEWAAYGPDAKRNTEAFVAGINAYVKRVRGNAALMPVEFKLAGYEPAFWQAEDVVRVRNHGFVVGATYQLMRAQVACKAGTVTAATELPFKVTPPWTPVVPQGLDLCSIPPNVLDQYQLAQKPVVFKRLEGSRAARKDPRPMDVRGLDLGSTGQGSNNWVIGPSKSATGRPILANDPHRELAVPGLRYIAHVVAPGLNIIGAGEPALPGILVGHNERIAFGLTVFPIAQEDLYVYETNPQNPDEYRYRDAWEPMRVLHETLPVRGAPEATVELKFTRHGPVVLEDREHHRAYAVRATSLDTGGAPYFGALRYQQARNEKEFAAALKYWGNPGENQVYADTTGQIGWFPAGFTPIRSNSDGLLPLPGDGRYEWGGGYLDRDLLPSEINPPRGYIATANQMDLPKDYPYAQRRISFSWPDEYRFNRITQVLDGLPKVSLQDSQALQNDSLTLPGRRLVRLLGQITTRDQDLRDTVRWLAEWDGRVTVESPQAALFEVWVSHHLGSAVIDRIVPAAPQDIRATIGTSTAIVELMERPDQRFGAHPQRVRDEIMLGTLAAAVNEMKQRQGSDRSVWKWGKLTTVLLEHPLAPLADESRRLEMNVGPAAKSGDGDVVGVAHYRAQDFRVQIAASFRMVLDVGHWDDSLAVNAPGQSGDPSSPHYRDLFALWLEGKYFPLVYTRAAVEKVTERKIILESTNK
jgi:penicillin amidase